MAVIRIKNLRLRTFIGFADHELEKLQDVVINMRFCYDATTAESSDQASDALNYRTITKEVIEFVENNKFHLLEKMAKDVLAIIASYDEVSEASVEIDKPHALRFADSVSVEESFSRQ